MHPRTHQQSLWDVEDTDDLPPIGEMTVDHVSRDDVEEILWRYHYLHIGGACLYNYGLWHHTTCLGIVSYNIPTRQTCESVYGPEHHKHVWHMTRLALADKVPLNAESRLIGGSLKMIQRERPDIWAILTYADVAVGHVGYVYQATNALYTGRGGYTVYYEDQQGHRRGTYDGRFVSKDRAINEKGWTVHDSGEKKHRYLYILGGKVQRKQRRRMLQLPVLPYPKGAPRQLDSVTDLTP